MGILVYSLLWVVQVLYHQPNYENSSLGFLIIAVAIL